MKREKITNDFPYHIYSRSIAEFKIFSNDADNMRFIEAMKYFQNTGHNNLKFSYFLKFRDEQKSSKFENNLVDIIAYCIMPTHFHLILKQKKGSGISNFMSNLLNSYTRYFNTRYKRKGPLWEGRYKGIRIEKDDYLIHLTRYIHLNPVSALLVDKPEEWKASSYNEYIGLSKEQLTNAEGLFDFSFSKYKDFVEDRISYQQELAKIKSLIFE
jgi:putative transposase